MPADGMRATGSPERRFGTPVSVARYKNLPELFDIGKTQFLRKGISALRAKAQPDCAKPELRFGEGRCGCRRCTWDVRHALARNGRAREWVGHAV
jgi:hypothetical protein